MTDERLLELAAAFHSEYAAWNFRGREVIRDVDDAYGLEVEVKAVFGSVDEAAERCSVMADIAAMRAVLGALTGEERERGLGDDG